MSLEEFVAERAVPLRPGAAANDVVFGFCTGIFSCQWSGVWFLFCNLPLPMIWILFPLQESVKSVSCNFFVRRYITVRQSLTMWAVLRDSHRSLLSVTLSCVGTPHLAPCCLFSLPAFVLLTSVSLYYCIISLSLFLSFLVHLTTFSQLHSMFVVTFTAYSIKLHTLLAAWEFCVGCHFSVKIQVFREIVWDVSKWCSVIGSGIMSQKFLTQLTIQKIGATKLSTRDPCSTLWNSSSNWLNKTGVAITFILSCHVIVMPTGSVSV
jgi:hypothetical protein